MPWFHELMETLIWKLSQLLMEHTSIVLANLVLETVVLRVSYRTHSSSGPPELVSFLCSSAFQQFYEPSTTFNTSLPGTVDRLDTINFT